LWLLAKSLSGTAVETGKWICPLIGKRIYSVARV
jgi:hypothetical protein